MPSKAEQAVQRARHALVTLHGLMAYDDGTPVGIEQAWRLDTMADVAAIDMAARELSRLQAEVAALERTCDNYAREIKMREAFPEHFATRITPVQPPENA